MANYSVDDILNLPDNKKRDTLEKILAELKNLKGQNKYGLQWDLNATTEGDETVIKDCQFFFPILDAISDADGLKHLTQFAPPQSDLFDNPDKPQPTHLLIEGDNYHALNALLYTHRKAVDLIYIDPPYNTGNKDFRYNDNFVDKENPDKHTLWLSFMKHRLVIAKELLKDTGAIFISIDENEIAQLKLLCDKVFGETNFIEQLVWNKRIPKNDKGIGNIHEYILLYAKKYSSEHTFVQKKGGIEDVTDFVANLKKRRISISEAENDLKKFYKKNAYDRGITLYNSFDKDYRLWGKINVSWPNAKTVGPRYDVLHPKTKKPCKVPDRGWRFTKDTFDSLIDYSNIEERHDGSFKCGRVWFAKDENTQPSTIKYLDEVSDFLLRSIISTKSDGNSDLISILNHVNFDYPKSKDLIEILIDSIQKTDAVILDFFAGSGTTGHAVLELNKQDGGRRQFILVTNNEVTDKTQTQLRKEGKTETEIEALGICRSVTYPRLQKVIEGYTTPKGEKVAGTGGRLRYYRTAYVDRSPNFDQQAYNFKGKCTEMLCIKENVFTPLADSNDQLYDAEGWEVYRDYDKTLAVLHDDTPQYRTDLKAVLDQQTGEKVLYVFCVGSGISLDEYRIYFGKDVKVEAMPTEIMGLYKRQFDNKKK